jgi:hypothetical protein
MQIIIKEKEYRPDASKERKARGNSERVTSNPKKKIEELQLKAPPTFHRP